MSLVDHTLDETAASAKGVRRVGVTGVILGVVTVVACELPLLLALIGLGGLGSVAAGFTPSPMVEMIGIGLGLLGLLVLIGLLGARLVRRAPG